MISSTQRKIGRLFLLFHFISLHLFAGIHPGNGSVLSQVHIMFEWEDIMGADMYELTVYQIENSSCVAVLEKVVQIKTPNLTWLETQKLSFGNRYKWQFRAFKKQQVLFTSSTYQFRILESPQVNPDSFRTEIKYVGNPGSGITFLDRSAMAIDKKGKPVWFLPVRIDTLAKRVIRDLKMTAYGTITHLDINGAYEKDLTGTVLWQAPDDGRVSGGSKEEYHHEMRKNKDGTYDVCGSAYEPGKKTAGQIRYNTIIHYASKGEILWSWNEWNSLQNDLLFKQSRLYKQAGHLNGFSFTQDGKKVFMSFKNLSDVYLYDIAEGKFISSLKHLTGNGLTNFQQQHGPFLTNKNELLIYNNNITEKDDGEGEVVSHPSVMIFKYDTVRQSCSLVWEYEVRSPKYPEGIKGKEGYVSETKSGTLLVCPGGANYALEVNRQKQKVWEAYFYYREGKDTSWKSYTNYRCQSSSSLYPLYFTLQYVGVKEGKRTFRLHNAGSEAGSFALLFSDSVTQKTVKLLSKQVLAGQSQLVQLPQGFYTGKALACQVMPLHVASKAKQYLYDKME